MANLKDTIILGSLAVTNNINAAGTITGSKVYNAVFNDYAEYRLCKESIEPGYIVTEDRDNCDHVKLCTSCLGEADMFVVSDTYGQCMGVAANSVPVALSGRVLVHCDPRYNYVVGDYVGCDDHGRARKLMRLEAHEYPERVLGRVSSIPNYEYWGTENVAVNGRIWVNIKR